MQHFVGQALYDSLAGHPTFSSDKVTSPTAPVPPLKVPLFTPPVNSHYYGVQMVGQLLLKLLVHVGFFGK